MKTTFLTAVEIADRVSIKLCGTKFHVLVDREACGRAFIQVYHYFRSDEEEGVIRVDGRKWHLQGDETRTDILNIIRAAFNAAVEEIMPKAFLLDGKAFFDQSHLIVPFGPEDRECIDEELFKPELCDV